MILANSFNENDSSVVRDYSDTREDTTFVTGITPTVDTFGYFAAFDGVTGQYVNDGSVISFTEFSILVELRINGSEAGVSPIYFKNKNSHLFYNGGNLEFTIEDGVSTHINSIAINTDQWYRVVCTYSNTNGSTLYVDDTIASDSNTLVLDATENLRVGSDSIDFLDGSLREFRVYAYEFTIDQAQTVLTYSQGIDINIPSHTFEVGDMLTEFINNPQAVVFAIEADVVRYLPMSSTLVQDDITIMRIGNRFDVDRQSFFEIDIDEERLCIYNEVDQFSDIGEENNCVVTVDKRGVMGMVESSSFLCQTGNAVVPKDCVSIVLEDVLFEMNTDGSYSPIDTLSLNNQFDLFLEDNGDGTISLKDVTL